MSSILYKSGYKYQLHEKAIVETSIIEYDITTEFLNLSNTGKLTINAGYAWDGASGPIADTPNILRGSLYHDSLYQLMRLDLISADKYRKTADELLKQTCLDDGVNSLIAAMIYAAVRTFGFKYTQSSSETNVLIAPNVDLQNANF